LKINPGFYFTHIAPKQENTRGQYCKLRALKGIGKESSNPLPTANGMTGM
jgi:hypothetical protein